MATWTEQPRGRNIHWRAPVFMTLSLLTGICVAFGHHAFYQSLDSRKVSSDPINFAGWSASPQQLNIAAGTALAFLFKSSLVLASSTAYFQLLFLTIHSGTFSFNRLDKWFSSLDDLWSLFCITTYVKFPLLPVIAVTAWLLPIAAIISPASLTVVFQQVLSDPQTSYVPQPAFDSLAFGSIGSHKGPWHYYSPNGTQSGEVGSITTFYGPSEEVCLIANAVASSGSILPIPAPGINASWQVSFEGPRVSCVDMEDSLVDDIQANITNTLLAIPRTGGLPLNEVAYPISYLAWMNNSNEGIGPLPFDDDWVLQTQPSSVTEEPSLQLFLAVFPDPVVHPISFVALNDTFFHWLLANSTYLVCSLGVANYESVFTYNGTNQDQYIQTTSSEGVSHLSEYQSAVSFNVTDQGDLAILPSSNLTDRLALRQWSYVSIWHAMTILLLGASSAWRQDMERGRAAFPMRNSTELFYQTQVFYTSLIETEELSPLVSDYLPAYDMVQNSENTKFSTSTKAIDEAASLLPPVTTVLKRKKLKDAIEELFFNITMSMASSEVLRYNDTSKFAPPPVNVTYSTFGNVYSYAADKLWLAYGLALALTLLNVGIGFWAIARLGASFTENFSSMVRVAKNSTVEVDMQEPHLAGRDPLPKHVAKAQLHLGIGDAAQLVPLSPDDYARIAEADHSDDTSKIEPRTVPTTP